MSQWDWRIAAASVVGTSHEKTDQPCQDAHFCTVAELGGERAAFLVVSDGAGSARHSDLGAEAACRFFSAQIRETPVPLDQRELQAVSGVWLKALRTEIAELAEMKDAHPRDFACTLIFAILFENRTITGQIGDGAIVIRDDDRWFCPHWPQHGEFANMTNFVTSPDAPDCLEVAMLDSGMMDVAIFTDGIERMVLDHRRRTPHEPFFESMFSAVHGARTPALADRLSDQLASYLRSPTIRTRTDDDVTLVLASRVPRDAGCGEGGS